jgi:hypothetical protein
LPDAHINLEEELGIHFVYLVYTGKQEAANIHIQNASIQRAKYVHHDIDHILRRDSIVSTSIEKSISKSKNRGEAFVVST